MALVERLMHWGAFEADSEPPTFEPRADWIAVHDFFAASLEILMGNLTVNQVKTALSMDAGDEADFDDMIANVNAGADDGEKHRVIDQFHAIFILAEKRRNGYSTPAGVRSKLSI